MKRFMLGLGIVLSAAVLAGCADKEQPPVKAAKPAAADVAAGKTFAERECKGCHGLDGRGTASAIPNLAAQRERYLLAALKAYKEGKRTHAALRKIAENMSDADTRGLAAYYASLPPVQAVVGKDNGALVAPYERGKELAAACSKCHGEDGSSKIAGTPGLAGQQPQYLFIAIQEYLNKERKAAPMHALLPGLSKLDKESLALYFASQTPAQRAAPDFGDAAAGEPLTAVCGGCHGVNGVSTDAATPSLAAQDARYLVEAVKAYRTTRQREKMRLYITGLDEKEIQNIAAFYSAQTSGPSVKGQTMVQDLTEKCERCHGAGVPDNPAIAVPKINGQDRDYLIMALRAYRDDRREASIMHKMSLPYNDSIIESLASVYASRPVK